MQNNFGRAYRLRIETKTGNTITRYEIGETPVDGRPLHISFDLERADSQILNTAQIAVWNLSKEHRNALATSGAKVYLSAGYQNNLPQIFVGTVVKSYTERDGGDRKTIIEVVDGFEALCDKVVSIGFAEQVTAFSLLVYVGEKIIGTPVITPEARRRLESTRAESYSFFGKASDMLNEICGASRTQWNIQNGVLTVSAPNEPSRTFVYNINAETGLIGFPKRIFESSVGIDENNESTNSYSMIGWEIEYLLNGAIGVGDSIKLKSVEHDLEGTYYVYNLHISGDNYGGDWKCRAQIREIGTPEAKAEVVSTNRSSSGRSHLSGGRRI